MKIISQTTREHFVKGGCRLVQIACYIALAFYVFGLVLSIMGRQAFTFHAGTGTYDGVIYAQESYEAGAEGMTISTQDGIHITPNHEGKIDWITQMGLLLLYAVQMVPAAMAVWFLSRVCANVYKGEIFIGRNARYLSFYGAIQIFIALAVPFLKLIVCFAVNRMADSQMAISTGQNSMQTLVAGVGFLLAAYIIGYGVGLQDEVDHTL